jgi:hypothetical protein
VVGGVVIVRVLSVIVLSLAVVLSLVSGASEDTGGTRAERATGPLSSSNVSRVAVPVR